MMTDQIYQLLQGSGRGGNQGPRGDQGGVAPNSLLPMGTQSQGMGGLSDLLRRQTAYRGFDLGMLLQLLNSIIGGDNGGGGGGGNGGGNGSDNGGGSTGCLCAGVLVHMADGSKKFACEIEVDDIVMGYDPAIGDVPQAVHTVQSSRQPCAWVTLEGEDGIDEIEASLTHNWFTIDGNVVPTTKLEEGMELWGIGRKPLKVVSLSNAESQVVYWWNVTPNGNYYAGGVLHHNASSTSITKNPGYTPSSYLGYTPIGGGGEPL